MSDKPNNPGEDFLKRLAQEALASDEKDFKIMLSSQRNFSIGWENVAVHPLQPLENVYRRVVREAVDNEMDRNERQKKESSALSKFFFFDVSEVKLLNVNDNEQEEEFLEEKLLKVRKNLATLIRYITSQKEEDCKLNDQSKLNNIFYEQVKELDEILNKILAVRGYNPQCDTDIVPILAWIIKELNGYKEEIMKAEDLPKLYWDKYRKVVQYLGRVLNGLARIQMSYIIEPFYLFRFLVNFRLTSNKEILADEQKKVSGQLTGLLNHTNFDWLGKWLEQKIVELNTELLKINNDDKEKVHFYLKGGRALKYLEGKPQDGTNDWDTSILINPELPAEEWYKTFAEVHNIVLRKLKDFKLEFFMLLHKHAESELPKEEEYHESDDSDNMSATYSEVEDDKKNLDFDFEEVVVEEDGSGTRDAEESELLPKYAVNVKAELIDIGIPRRDTVEAFEQWLHTKIITKNGLDSNNQVPIPNYLYYISEYIMILREALDPNETSPLGKLPKRIRRIYGLLSPEDSAQVIDQVIGKKKDQLNRVLPESLQVVNQEQSPFKRLLVVILEQFVKAYSLRIGSDSKPITKVFDKLFSTKSDKKDDIKYTEDLQEAIDNAEPKLKDNEKLLFRWIAVAREVSSEFEEHFKCRAKFFGFGTRSLDLEGKRKQKLINLVRTLYKSPQLFSDQEELQVQFAVTGSYAAYLYADYNKLADNLKEQLDPVNTIEIKFFFASGDSKPDPKVAIDLVKNIMLKALAEYSKGDHISKLLFNLTEDDQNKITLIYWDEYQEEENSPFKYKPLLVEISLVVTDQSQKLEFIWGFPVISLRDLIREYNRKAAEAEEFAATRRFSKTASILAEEILIKYD